MGQYYAKAPDARANLAEKGRLGVGPVRQSPGNTRGTCSDVHCLGMEIRITGIYIYIYSL